MVICLELGADLHMSQLMPLPLTVSCFSKIQIGFTFLVPAQLGSPGKRAVKRVCVSAPINLVYDTIRDAILTALESRHKSAKSTARNRQLKKCKNRKKPKSKKTDMLRSNSKQSGKSI